MARSWSEAESQPYRRLAHWGNDSCYNHRNHTRFSMRPLQLFKKLAYLVFLSMLAGACVSEPYHRGSTTPGIITAAPSDWYSVYFTDPSNPQADSYRGGPDEALAHAIDQA